MPAWCHISRSASTSARLRPAVAEDEGETASWAIAVPARPRVRAASAAERVRMSDPFKRPLGIHFLTAWTYYAALQHSSSVRFLTCFRDRKSTRLNSSHLVISY